MSAALELQRRLNIIRKNREHGELAPIEETGVADEATRHALRAFQHEFNRFAGMKILIERGQLDPATEEAILWMLDLIEKKKEKAA